MLDQAREKVWHGQEPTCSVASPAPPAATMRNAPRATSASVKSHSEFDIGF